MLTMALEALIELPVIFKCKIQTTIKYGYFGSDTVQSQCSIYWYIIQN